MLTRRELSLSFNTPAFLGNAEQSGQWRTPPFKSQLRQWWRVAFAEENGFRPDVGLMREEEGKLFGNAWIKDNFSKSLVRIRLGEWRHGKLKSWDRLEQERIDHPEAEKSGKKVGPHAYLGFGPLDGRGGTKLSEKANAAIQAGEENTFSIAYPDECDSMIGKALFLMHKFGTVGGRSRNGWGSYNLHGVGNLTNLPQRPWQDALTLDWPHAIGSDANGALIWQTQSFSDWMALMKELAVLKIKLRTQFPLSAGKTQHPEDRHWLSYPVTNHQVTSWGGNRLPNSLRFKIRKTEDDTLVGMIFHMPCLPPPAFNPKAKSISDVWKKVHDFLDGSPQIKRIPG